MPVFDETKLRLELAVLLMAPPGAGKTTFMLQWPGLGLLNLDNNLAGPVRFLKKHGKLQPFKYHNIFEDEKGVKLLPEEQIKRLQACVQDFLNDPEVTTIAIDSMTALDLCLIGHVLKQQGKINKAGQVLEDAVMEIQYWKPWRAILLNIINKVRNSGKNFFLLTHVEYKFKSLAEGGGLEKILPTMSSTMRDWIGYAFTDVWFLNMNDVGGGQLSPVLLCVKDATKDLKNSLLLPAQFKADPAHILELIAKAKTL